MSVRSTWHISRKLALEVLRSRKWEELSNDELASILYELKESKFRNYTVEVDKFRLSPNREITSVEDFNDEWLTYPD